MEVLLKIHIILICLVAVYSFHISVMGKVFVITGTSRGIGLEICQWLLSKGHSVVGISRTKTEFENERYLELNLDLAMLSVGSQELGHFMMDKAMEKFNRIDGFIHNAGMLGMARLENLESELLDKVMTVNLYAAINIIKHLLPQLRQTQGIVILVSSGASTKPYQGWGAYCMSKSSMNMYCQLLAQEEPSITCISVRPGVVDTDMQQDIRTNGIHSMGPANHTRFKKMKEDGKLLDAKVPAQAIGNFAVNPRQELSGQFVDYTDLMEK